MSTHAILSFKLKRSHTRTLAWAARWATHAQAQLTKSITTTSWSLNGFFFTFLLHNLELFKLYCIRRFNSVCLRLYNKVQNPNLFQARLSITIHLHTQCCLVVCIKTYCFNIKTHLQTWAQVVYLFKYTLCIKQARTNNKLNRVGLDLKVYWLEFHNI